MRDNRDTADMSFEWSMELYSCCDQKMSNQCDMVVICCIVSTRMKSELHLILDICLHASPEILKYSLITLITLLNLSNKLLASNTLESKRRKWLNLLVFDSIIYSVIFCKLTYQQFQFSKSLEISNFSLISLITLLKLTNKLLGSNIFESKWRNLKNSLFFDSIRYSVIFFKLEYQQ